MKNLILHARLNHGRWIVDCPHPDCRGAEIVHPGMEFVCQSCVIEGREYGRMPVVFPEDYHLINQLVSARPAPNRNWEPGETVEDLRRENFEHGIR